MDSFALAFSGQRVDCARLENAYFRF